MVVSFPGFPHRAIALYLLVKTFADFILVPGRGLRKAEAQLATIEYL